MIEIPTKRWLTIEEVWAVLVSSGILSRVFSEDKNVFGEGKSVFDEAYFAAGSWICEAAFSGDLQLKGCRAEPHGEGIGEPVDIPSEYFRRPRAVYGSAGISRLSWEETDDELIRDENNMRAGRPEPDWDDVLILRESFVRALQKKLPVKSGDPGRPTSKQLYIDEFNRRSQSGIVCATLSAESEYLSNWLRTTYPLQPTAEAGAIANRIRPLFLQRAPGRSA
jgi:hypothetical protein